MALQTSGTISMSDIAAELSVSNSNLSLRTLSANAGKSVPDAISEFYGYSAGPVVVLTPYEASSHRSEIETCNNGPFTRPSLEVFLDETNFFAYEDQEGLSYVRDGYYYLQRLGAIFVERGRYVRILCGGGGGLEPKDPGFK